MRLLACALSSVLLSGLPVWAHLPKPVIEAPANRTDIQCFLSDEKIASMTVLDVVRGSRKGLEYAIFLYSLDGGEKVNLALLHPYQNGRVSPFPTVYVFGDVLNAKNGQGLQVYVDQTGDGVCKTITFEAQEAH